MYNYISAMQYKRPVEYDSTGHRIVYTPNGDRRIIISAKELAEKLQLLSNETD